MALRAVANQLLSSLFEPPCAGCRQRLLNPLDGAVCENCWIALSLAHPINERFPANHAVSWACAVDHYDGRMKEILHALKYERRRSISPRLAALMRERGAGLLHDADRVVPVPLHPHREFARGFNQSEDLARGLGPPVARLLRRVRHTPSQIDLALAERRTNVKDAFALSDGASVPAKGVVVLVDDVSTSGATLAECAAVLKRGGVREVRALTAARVVAAGYARAHQ